MNTNEIKLYNYIQKKFKGSQYNIHKIDWTDFPSNDVCDEDKMKWVIDNKKFIYSGIESHVTFIGSDDFLYEVFKIKNFNIVEISTKIANNLASLEKQTKLELEDYDVEVIEKSKEFNIFLLNIITEYQEKLNLTTPIENQTITKPLKTYFISKEVLNQVNNVREYAEFLSKNKQGETIDLEGIGEAERFTERFESFKQTLKSDFPDLTFEQIPLILGNAARLNSLINWFGLPYLLGALELELHQTLSLRERSERIISE